MTNLFQGATGVLVRYVSPGDDRDMLLGLVRTGVKFKAQHGQGKRPGALSRAIDECVKRVGPDCSLNQLIDQLERVAALDSASGIIEVDRIARLVTYESKNDLRDIKFRSLSYHLTKSRNN